MWIICLLFCTLLCDGQSGAVTRGEAGEAREAELVVLPGTGDRRPGMQGHMERHERLPGGRGAGLGGGRQRSSWGSNGTATQGRQEWAVWEISGDLGCRGGPSWPGAWGRDGQGRRISPSWGHRAGGGALALAWLVCIAKAPSELGPCCLWELAVSLQPKKFILKITNTMICKEIKNKKYTFQKVHPCKCTPQWFS